MLFFLDKGPPRSWGFAIYTRASDDSQTIQKIPFINRKIILLPTFASVHLDMDE
jgi:hypothetical protein